MSVLIGHASSDENRKANGGNSGDQTKKEVCTRDWYNKPWTSVIRPKDSAQAEKIAKAMEQACANDKIGYDQYQRTTLYTQAKEHNWDLSKITTACECDCSALVAVCVNAAGISVSKDIYTGNEQSALKATGKFDVYTDSKYTGAYKYLKRGDILLGSGHTAVVLSDGSGLSASNATSANVIDTVNEVQTWLNTSYSAGLDVDGKYGPKTKKALIKALQKNLGVTVDGDYGTKTNNAVKVLKKGDKGEIVKVLQCLLVCNGYTSAYVDGSYGNGTFSAVYAYQKKKGLEVDGIAGKATFSALCK